MRRLRIVADGQPTLERLTPGVIATRSLALVYRREVKRSREVRAVIRMVTDVMREHADRMRGGE